jgi:hypothetical protein
VGFMGMDTDCRFELITAAGQFQGFLTALFINPYQQQAVQFFINLVYQVDYFFGFKIFL